MKSPDASRQVALWASLVVPSLMIVHKVSGWTGVAVYVAAVTVAVRFRRLADRLPTQTARVCGALTAIAVIATFAIVYPIVNVQTPNAGSDHDEADDIGVFALIEGESPYGRTTYLGNVLHQLPGALLLAAPFTALGTSALQNLFWIALFFAAVRRVHGRAGPTLGLAWLVLAGSPTVMHGVVTGTAHVANTIYVALGLWWMTRTRYPRIAAACWGVALASRPNFLFVLPLAWGYLRRHRDLRTANWATAIAGLVVAALVLPFYLLHPESFGPLEAADRLTRFDQILPFASALVVAAMTLSTLAFALSRSGESPTVFRHAAVVQAIPVAAGLALKLFQYGVLDLDYATYGTFAAWFVFMDDAMSRRGANARETGS